VLSIAMPQLMVLEIIFTPFTASDIWNGDSGTENFIISTEKFEYIGTLKIKTERKKTAGESLNR
jgi:hypothetical protein